MNAIPDDKILTGIWKNGQIVLEKPTDWPEGCRLVVTPEEAPRKKRRAFMACRKRGSLTILRRSQGGWPSSTQIPRGR